MLNYVDNHVKAVEVAERIKARHRKVVVHQGNVGKSRVAEDVAGAVLFLASDLSCHITGATINVNEGSVLV